MALKSAKTLHTFLSRVRHGPNAVKRAENEIEALSSILSRLANRQTPELQADAALAKTLRECRYDLTSFSDKLASLDTSSSASRREEYTKRLMVALNEKELEKIASTVARYASTINAHLTVTQAYV